MSAKTVARISLPHFMTSAKRVTEPERTTAAISGEPEPDVAEEAENNGFLF